MKIIFVLYITKEIQNNSFNQLQIFINTKLMRLFDNIPNIILCISPKNKMFQFKFPSLDLKQY